MNPSDFPVAVSLGCGGPAIAAATGPQLTRACSTSIEQLHLQWDNSQIGSPE